MHLNCAIIDDNSTDARYISGIVKHWSVVADHTVRINEFGSAEEFLFQYEDEKDYDILLLDIEMGGMNGVELAKKIRKDNETVQIVFITGFPDFIAEGYEVSALHYLMKPVDTEKLCGVLDKAVCNLGKYERRLCVTFDRQTVFVPLRQIMYIEAQKQYVEIHTIGQSYRMKASLTETEESLDEYFFKCQRSYVVNLRYVSKIKPDCVLLKNGEEIPISRGMAEKIGKEIIRLF